MGKRNSVSILATSPVMSSSSRECESKTVEVRQIDNGFIKRESSWKGDKYESRETYSANQPSLDDNRETNVGAETFRAAIKALK